MPAYRGGSWTLGGGCRLRTAFRDFRVDRILALDVTDRPCGADPARPLAAYRRRLPAMGVASLP